MKPWGGRFQKDTDRLVEEFTASIHFDRRLYRYDILGSIAHCRMLAQQQIIQPADSDAIVAGLRDILAEIESGQFTFKVALEDIHMNVESRLANKIGEVAGKLHTARSRNDQVALDLRLYVRDIILQTVGNLGGLQQALLEVAQRYPTAAMPGYTHLQRAQPVLLAHHMLAYFEMFQRDIERLQDGYARCDVMPLGSGALAGTGLPIDRQAVASALGFSQISRNSLDAVSDRDFVAEFIFAAAATMMHLSRLGEEFVLWSSGEFGFVDLDDAYSTGSSMMPQKKNPDVAELVRGKTGRVYGHLQGLLTVLKGLPLTYNRDLQEDKEALFDTVDTVLASLRIVARMLSTTKFKGERMAAAAGEGFMLATDVADYLALRGLPFRRAHEVVGKLVSYCLKNDKELADLNLEEYTRFSPLFHDDVLAITVQTSVESRDCPGGTSPRQLVSAVAIAKAALESTTRWIQTRSTHLESCFQLLLDDQ